jgi:hypothetical protein
MDLNGEVRQRAEPRQLRPVVVRATRPACVDRYYRREVARTQPPEMKVGDFVAFPLDRLPKVVRHGTIRIHVQQNSPCVTDQPKRPTSDHAGPDDTCEGVPSRAIRTHGRAADPQSPAPIRRHRRSRESLRRACCCRAVLSRARVRVPQRRQNARHFRCAHAQNCQTLLLVLVSRFSLTQVCQPSWSFFCTQFRKSTCLIFPAALIRPLSPCIAAATCR